MAERDIGVFIYEHRQWAAHTTQVN